jgi:hypothetical protein
VIQCHLGEEAAYRGFCPPAYYGFGTALTGRLASVIRLWEAPGADIHRGPFSCPEVARDGGGGLLRHHAGADPALVQPWGQEHENRIAMLCPNLANLTNVIDSIHRAVSQSNSDYAADLRPDRRNVWST